jgi:hypothetical protein
LMPAIGQLAIARALARVFARADAALIADLAGRGCARLIQLASSPHFADDEQEELSETLIEYLGIADLGAAGDSLRRRLVGLIGAARSHCPNRARQRLREILPGLPEDLRQRLEWA